MNQKGNKQVAYSVTELEGFLTSTLAGAEFKMEKVKVASQDQWAYRDGAFSHKSNAFFHVVGVRKKRKYRGAPSIVSAAKCSYWFGFLSR